MTLNILDRGEGRFDLFHDDRRIGWIRSRTIAFVDYDDVDAARRAAEIAYDALSVWFARQRRTEKPPRRGRPVEMRRDGNDEVLTLSGVAIGRLCEPDAPGSPYGFALYLPPRVGSARLAAQVLDLALRRHRDRPPLDTVALLGGSDWYF
ncbi:MAG: hypothetical protein ABI442_03050 [Gemmatimonadaceae bacterium]